MSLNDILIAIIEAILRAISPKPTPTPTPIPPPTDFVSQLLILHNNHRKTIGVGQLTLNQALTNASQKHSDWMYKNKTLSHVANGKSPGDRISAEGYKWIAYGENIAAGFATPQAVFQGWLGSPDHRASIENPRFKDVGFGFAGKYWTAGFAAKSGPPMMYLPGGLQME